MSFDNGGAWVQARAFGINNPILPSCARGDVAKLLTDFDITAFINSLGSLDFSGLSGVDALLGASGVWSPLSWSNWWNVAGFVDGLVSKGWVEIGEISAFVLDDELLETLCARTSGNANCSHASSDGSLSCDWLGGFKAQRWLSLNGDGVVVGVALAGVGEDWAVDSLNASVA